MSNPTLRHKTRRGTVIIELDGQILLTRMRNDRFLLPGGKAERGESRICAAIRELQEETGLVATSAQFLFDYESRRYQHKVFYLRATGTPRPCAEVEVLDFYRPELATQIHDSSVQIIERFLQMRGNVSVGYPVMDDVPFTSRCHCPGCGNEMVVITRKSLSEMKGHRPRFRSMSEDELVSKKKYHQICKHCDEYALGMEFTVGIPFMDVDGVIRDVHGHTFPTR